MLECVIKQNQFTSLDRIYLEGWLLNNQIEYRLGRFGDWLAWLTPNQIEDLKGEGWTVYVL